MKNVKTVENIESMKSEILMKKKQLGQGMVEYIIIVALVAVAAIGGYSYFGNAIKHQIAGITNEISGTSAKSEIAAAKKAAEESVKTAGKKADMGTYDASGTSAIKDIK